MTSFEVIKKKLIKAPIVVIPNWDEPFEIMCGASDYAVELFWDKGERTSSRPYIMRVKL